MLQSVGEGGKYVMATVASPFENDGRYHVFEKLKLLSMHWLSMMECNKGRGRINSMLF